MRVEHMAFSALVKKRMCLLTDDEGSTSLSIAAGP